ncbi:LEG3 protein, partial [Polyodon spathula]|nr:LEG3 protein [Polyodon spathula]
MHFVLFSGKVGIKNELTKRASAVEWSRSLAGLVCQLELHWINTIKMSDGLNLSDALFGDSASSAPTVSNPAGPWNPNMGYSNPIPGFPAAGGQQPQPAMMSQLPVPFDMPLQVGVHDKLLFTIVGTIKPKPISFTIDFKRGNDIAFHCNPRFNDEGKKAVVRNSFVNGRWGPEERQLTQFPFVEGQPFEIAILVTGSQFKMAVNRTHLLEFNHRVKQLNEITNLRISGDVFLNSVLPSILP